MSDPPEAGRWHPLVRALVYLFCALVAMNLVALVIIVALVVATGQTELLTEVTERPESALSTWVTLAASAVGAPVVLLVTLYFRRRLDRRSVRSLGLRTSGAAREFGTGWLGGALAPGVLFGVGLLAGAYEIGDAGDSSPAFERIGALPLLLAMGGFALQGSAEELMVRGYVQRNMVEWKAGQRSWLWVLVMPSVIFSIAHAANPGFGLIPFANTVLIGIFFAALVLARGELWSACGVHAGWNFGLAVVWSLPVSGLETERLLPVEVLAAGPVVERLFGGAYGPEGGLATTLLVIVGLAVVAPRTLRAFAVDAWGTRVASDSAGQLAREPVAGLLDQARAHLEDARAPGGVVRAEHLEQLAFDRDALLRLELTVLVEPVVGAHGGEHARGIVRAELGARHGELAVVGERFGEPALDRAVHLRRHRLAGVRAAHRVSPPVLRAPVEIGVGAASMIISTSPQGPSPVCTSIQATRCAPRVSRAAISRSSWLDCSLRCPPNCTPCGWMYWPTVSTACSRSIPCFCPYSSRRLRFSTSSSCSKVVGLIAS